MRRKINNQYLAKLNRRLSLMQFEAPGWVKILALLRGHILEKKCITSTLRELSAGINQRNIHYFTYLVIIKSIEMFNDSYNQNSAGCTKLNQKLRVHHGGKLNNPGCVVQLSAKSSYRNHNSSRTNYFIFAAMIAGYFFIKKLLSS